MKNYLSTKRVNSRQPYLPKGLRYTIWILLGLLVLLYLVPRFVQLAVYIALYPLEATRVWVMESTDSLPLYLRERSKLVSEIEALKQEVATNDGTENTLAKLEAENERFRLLCAAVPQERVIARVIGRPPQLPYDVLMLDRGSQHGVVEMAPVFVGSDQIVGYVSRVYEKTSLVTMVSTADFVSMAYIIGPDIYTYAKGVGGGMLRVEVPQGIPLHVGDMVILPAIDSGVYGAIAEVTTSPTQPEQFGYVPMTQNLQSMQYVSIGKEVITPHSYEEAEGLLVDLRQNLFSINLPEGILVTPVTKSSTTSTSSLPVTAGTSTVE